MGQITRKLPSPAPVGEGEIMIDPFDLIMTIGDAVRHYKRSRSTLLWHIDKGNIRAQKIGRYWLLIRADLDRMYKSPRR